MYIGGFCEFQKFKVGVDFSTIFAETSGVQFDTSVGAFAGSKEIKVKTGVVTSGTVPEFFRKIRVANYLEQSIT